MTITALCGPARVVGYVNSLGISPSVVPCASGAPPGHRTMFCAKPAGGEVIVAAACAAGVACVCAASGRVTRRMEAASSSRFNAESIAYQVKHHGNWRGLTQMQRAEVPKNPTLPVQQDNLRLA